MHLRISLILAVLVLAVSAPSQATSIYVSPSGSDSNPGTLAKPLQTLTAAQSLERKSLITKPGFPVDVWLMAGTYYLAQTLVFSHADSGTPTAPVTYSAMPGATVVISGGIRLNLNWQPYKNGIMMAALPKGFSTDQLFVNDQREPLARYPNFDPSQPILNGYAADAISPDRVKSWSDPTGGFIQTMQSYSWGSLAFQITGKDTNGNLTYQGGWQINRQSLMHPTFRYVEGIFEELDAPDEWFDDQKSGTLYYYPPAGLNLSNAVIEGVRLTNLVEFDGNETAPVRYVRLNGITFRHSARTFMLTREPILRSDWCIYRGGAIFFNGAEHCAIRNCFLDQPGGNAVFVNNYNRNVTIQGCHIFRAGASGVVFLGDQNSVRNGIGWNTQNDFNTIDKTPGPKTDNYPANCLVDDCLIHETGRFEKQSAGVEIDIASGITVSHCSIYDVPRSGVNIGDGAFGGDLIEDNDIFNTVLETGDHGSFNSWGRDRYWNIANMDLNSVESGPNKQLPLLDVVQPIILRHNRWRCDHGWDIDLDDGSSNYIIEDNLCLNGGIKNREGFYRVVQNNIMCNNTFHAHVWFTDSQDIVRNNIVFDPYRPIGMTAPWGQEVDYNLLQSDGTATMPATALQQLSGRDQHSQTGDAMFADPAHGDYTAKAGSPALALGFKNFAMNDFGVTSPMLKAIAKTPLLPGSQAPPVSTGQRDATPADWLGAEIHNVSGLDEVSAAGVAGETGVWLETVPADSEAAKAGMKAGQVILKADGKPIISLPDLMDIWNSAPAGTKIALLLTNAQKPLTISVVSDGAKLTPLIATKTSAASGAAFEADVVKSSLVAVNNENCVSAQEVDVQNPGGGTGPDPVRNGTTLNGSGGTENLNDGMTFRGYGTGSSLTFLLNTNLHPAGYDLTEILTFAGHTDTRSGQDFSVSVAFASAPNTYAKLIPSASVNCDGGSSEIRIGDGNSVIVCGDAGKASEVAAIRFDFKDASIGYAIYREVQVVGSPTLK